MGDVFIETGKGYTNLRLIDGAQRKSDGRYELVAGDRIIDHNNPVFGEQVIAITPVSGEWECVTVSDERDGTSSMSRVPVLAWGLNIFGKIVPVTPDEPTGVPAGVLYAVQVRNDSRAFADGTIFVDIQTWFAYVSRKS